MREKQLAQLESVRKREATSAVQFHDMKQQLLEQQAFHQESGSLFILSIPWI